MIILNKLDLVYKAKRGNGKAFTKLIDENLKSMYRVGKGILSEEDDVEDAIQNTILNAYSNIKNLKNDELFKTWLIKILINECITLFYFEDLRISEISDIIGIPEGTVKSRLSRAKDKIAESMNGKEIM